MAIERVNPSTLGKPSGFSHAVRADNVVYLAGQTALDITGTIVDGGIVAQFRQAMTNLLTALDAAGGTPANLVDVTIYLLDIPDYQANGREIGKIWLDRV